MPYTDLARWWLNNFNLNKNKNMRNLRNWESNLPTQIGLKIHQNPSKTHQQKRCVGHFGADKKWPLDDSLRLNKRNLGIRFAELSEEWILGKNSPRVLLVGGWTNPSEKYATVKMGIYESSPIFGVKIPKIFELPPPSLGWLLRKSCGSIPGSSRYVKFVVFC